MQRPLRFASVIVPIVIAACSDAGDGDLFSASKGLGVGGSSNGAGSPAGISGGRTSSNGGSAVSSGGKSAATAGGASSAENGGTGAATGGASVNGGSVNGGSGGSNASSGGSKASSGGTASGGSPGASGGMKASGGSQAATGGFVSSGGGPSATGGSFNGNDCQQARAAVNDALALAQACEPGSEKQCLGFVQGECCPVAVNDPDSEATAKFSAALAKWQKACGGAVCLAVLCIEPTAASCQSRGLGSGHCVTGPDFSL